MLCAAEALEKKGSKRNKDDTDVGAVKGQEGCSITSNKQSVQKNKELFKRSCANHDKIQNTVHLSYRYCTVLESIAVILENKQGFC